MSFPIHRHGIALNFCTTYWVYLLIQFVSKIKIFQRKTLYALCLNLYFVLDAKVNMTLKLLILSGLLLEYKNTTDFCTFTFYPEALLKLLFNDCNLFWFSTFLSTFLRFRHFKVMLYANKTKPKKKVFYFCSKMYTFYIIFLHYCNAKTSSTQVGRLDILDLFLIFEEFLKYFTSKY